MAHHEHSAPVALDELSDTDATGEAAQPIGTPQGLVGERQQRTTAAGQIAQRAHDEKRKIGQPAPGQKVRRPQQPLTYAKRGGGKHVEKGASSGLSGNHATIHVSKS